jgi:hypothetical protein
LRITIHNFVAHHHTERNHQVLATRNWARSSGLCRGGAAPPGDAVSEDK